MHHVAQKLYLMIIPGMLKTAFQLLKLIHPQFVLLIMYTAIIIGLKFKFHFPCIKLHSHFKPGVRRPQAGARLVS